MLLLLLENKRQNQVREKELERVSSVTKQINTTGISAVKKWAGSRSASSTVICYSVQFPPRTSWVPQLGWPQPPTEQAVGLETESLPPVSMPYSATLLPPLPPPLAAAANQKSWSGEKGQCVGSVPGIFHKACSVWAMEILLLDFFCRMTVEDELLHSIIRNLTNLTNSNSS